MSSASFTRGVRSLAVAFLLVPLSCAAPGRLAWSSDEDIASYGGKSVDGWIDLLKAHIDKGSDEDKEACRRAA